MGKYVIWMKHPKSENWVREDHSFRSKEMAEMYMKRKYKGLLRIYEHRIVPGKG
jgi:hypothetical protein